MSNYDLLYGVSEVSRILQVEPDLIKTWSYKFSDYLNPNANPPKGIPRQYGLEDILVFSYIMMDWEEDPDIESIRYGLNAKEHFESPFIELISQLTPIFVDIPEGIDENWKRGIVFGGMSDHIDLFALADSYKLAGDRIVDAALSYDEEYDLFCPAIYNYRHSTELYLKAITGNTKNEHNLMSLLQELKILLLSEFNSLVPDWFEDIILVFNDFDPGGTSFRYGSFLIKNEVFVDIKHVKNKMNLLAESFQKIKQQRQRNILAY